MSADSCLFCKIAEKTLPAKAVYEDDQVLAFHDIHPKAPVHLLLIPKKHIKSLLEIESSDANLISHLLLTLPMLAKKQGLHEGKLEQILKEIVEESGYEAHVDAHTDSPKQASKRMASLAELNEWILKQAKKNQSNDLSAIFNRMMLIDLLDQQSHEDRQSVQLMTLHAAKGLEFPFVYLVGMEEEILPHHACLESPWIEEERRLTYVGITRAQQALCLSFAKQRKKAGSLQASTPSRFIDDLPHDHLSWHGVGQTRPPEESQAWAQAHLQGLKNLLGERK